MNARTLVAGLALASLCTLPLVASAQSYEHRLDGRVVNAWPFNLQLDRGPHIDLHPGTVIKPRGLTLKNGQFVQVIGHANPDGTFEADEIDLLPAPWRRF